MKEITIKWGKIPKFGTNWVLPKKQIRIRNLLQMWYWIKNKIDTICN